MLIWESDLEKILRLRGLTIRFRNLNRAGAHGQIVENEISIDLATRRPPGKTFIHECLHYMYEDMAHEEIYAREKAVWDHITNKQIEKVYRKMFRIVKAKP